jgi:hypothetical protein
VEESQQEKKRKWRADGKLHRRIPGAFLIARWSEFRPSFWAFSSLKKLASNKKPGPI